jgi:hypothetical protein
VRQFTRTSSDRIHRRSHLATAVAIAAIALVGAPGQALPHAEHGHPARIHEGSCEELGAVAFRLNGVGGSVDLDNAPVATPTPINPDSTYQVMVSETTIEATTDDLLAAEHAVMIYESDEAMDAIACGNVGGAMDGDELITGLAEAGVPGHLGFAVFRPEGDRTMVSVMLGHGLSPISASGASDAHDHAEGEEAMTAQSDEGPDSGHDGEGEEEGSNAVATPEA